MISNKKQLSIKKGFSLLEMLVYVSIMALIMVVVVNTLIVIIFTQRDIKNLRVIEQSAIASLDRITREIRDAGSIDPLSQFGVSPGKLILNTTNIDGSDKVVEFYVENGVLQFKDDGNVSPITSSPVVVSSLIFYNILGSSSQTIKMEITLESGKGQYLRSENFYMSATFR